MKAIILAGGYGTRLSEETSIIPKPMIEIGGKPLIWHLMKFFASFSITEFTVALGYKSEVIKHYFLQFPQLQADLKINLSSGKVNAFQTSSENWQVELIDTGDNTMTGGRLRRLRDQITDTFIFTYGDGLANVNINKLIEFHKSHGKLATVTAVKPQQRFGLLKISETGAVKAFAEKPDYNNELVNGGFFVLEPGVIDYIEGDSTSWEKAPCERLAADNQLMAYQHTGFWQCVDTLYELRLLRQLWEQGAAEWKTW